MHRYRNGMHTWGNELPHNILPFRLKNHYIQRCHHTMSPWIHLFQANKYKSKKIKCKKSTKWSFSYDIHSPLSHWKLIWPHVPRSCSAVFVGHLLVASSDPSIEVSKILWIHFELRKFHILPKHSERWLHSALPDTQAPYMHRNAILGQVIDIQFSVVSSLPSLFQQRERRYIKPKKK